MSINPTVLHRHANLELGTRQYEVKSRTDLLMSAIEKVSALALGIFSAYVSLELFVPFFIASISIGIYSYMNDKQSCEHNHAGSSCAHGLLEQLTGVKLPPIISLAANIAVTVCHIDHHAIVFVPIIASSLGAWLGKTASNYASLMNKEINVHLNKPSVPHNHHAFCC